MIVKFSKTQQNALLSWVRGIGAAEREAEVIPSGYQLVSSFSPGLGWDAVAQSGSQSIDLRNK
jgi:hypothetical protein